MEYLEARGDLKKDSRDLGHVRSNWCVLFWVVCVEGGKKKVKTRGGEEGRRKGDRFPTRSCTVPPGQ